MFQYFVSACIAILICMTLLWVISVLVKNVSIVDIFWGTGFIVVNSIYFYLTPELFARHILVFVLVVLWGLRLSVYLGIRNYGKGEDFRYQEFRRKYGKHRYWWFSFFQVFLLQGALIVIVALPLLGANFNTFTNKLNVLDYIGLLFWIIGFIFETVGDYQLAMFKKNPDNIGKVLNHGLWKYTRHPNYFGDVMIWIGFAFFSLATECYWPIVGTLIMVILILKVSGVALLEETITDRRPEYQDYIKKTSAFIPWFPKKTS